MLRIFIGLLIFVSVLSIFAGGYFAGLLTKQGRLDGEQLSNYNTSQQINNRRKQISVKKTVTKPNTSMKIAAGVKINKELKKRLNTETTLEGNNTQEKRINIQGGNQDKNIPVTELSDRSGPDSDKIPLTHIGSPIVFYRVQQKFDEGHQKTDLKRKLPNSDGAILPSTAEEASKKSNSLLPNVQNESIVYPVRSQKEEFSSEANSVADLLSTTQIQPIAQQLAIYSLRLGTYTEQKALHINLKQWVLIRIYTKSWMNSIENGLH